MKKFTSLIILIFIIVSALQAWSYDESSAIKQTAMDYMESWYQGNAKKNET
ncbi:MAG: hypothetical protein GY707_12370 [Desulfobacteraceae bacterium]|nr:hypothetical protein [Desulfobacteraceae bacterium]